MIAVAVLVGALACQPEASSVTSADPGGPRSRAAVTDRGFFEEIVPAIRTALVVDVGPQPNRVRRGVVVHAGRGVYGCFDPDAMRWAAVWRRPKGRPPFTMDSMAAVSYPDRPAKATRAPRLNGQLLMGAAELERSDDAVWRGVEIAGQHAVIRYEAGGRVIEEVLVARADGRVERHIRSGVAPRPGEPASVDGASGPQLFVVEVGSEVGTEASSEAGSEALRPGRPGSFPTGPSTVSLGPTIAVESSPAVADGLFSTRTLGLPSRAAAGRAVRPTDIAFRDGVAFVSTLDGDVWRVEDLESPAAKWRRVAAGLFEPMDVEVDAQGRLLVLGRDQISELVDIDQDGLIDRIDCVTDRFVQTLHTRDFATSFACEPGGTFVVAKGGIPSPDVSDPDVMGHRGAVVRIGSDGAEMLADGLRIPFVGRRADGALFVSDQQGHYVPSTPLHRIGEGVPFYGFEPTRRRADVEVAPPVVWFPYQENRSGAGFVTLSEAGFPSLSDAFAHVSWNGKLFPVATPERGQTFVWSLPVAFGFPTLNAATHPRTGAVYAVGLGISGYKPTTLRHTGLASVTQVAALAVPIGCEVRHDGLRIAFADPVPSTWRIGVRRLRLFDLKRTAKYGSGHFRWDGEPGEHEIVPTTMAVDGASFEIATPPIYRADVLALELAVTDTAGQHPGYAFELFTRPAHLARPTRRQLAEVARREGGQADLKPGDARLGAEVFQRFACAGCHSLTGQKLTGPPLNGLSARRPADQLEAFLRESILEPAKGVAEGYAAAMPSFAGVIPPQDLEHLLAYLKGL